MADVTALVWMVVATVPVVAASALLARRVGDTAVSRVAVGTFVATLQIVLTLQVLGALEQWEPFPLVLASFGGLGLLGVVAWRIRPTEREPLDPVPDAPTEGYPVWIKAVTVGALSVIGIAALLAAMFGTDAAHDSNLYHRPMVAAWQQMGTIWRFPALRTNLAPLGSYWSNGDLFALWTVIPLGRDSFVQLCSLVWAVGSAAALLAAARELGLRPWTSLVAVTAVLMTPAVLGFQLATLHIDLIVLQGLAIMVWAGLRWYRNDPQARWLVFAGLGAGLAVGAKQSALPFAVVFLGVLGVTACRRRRWAGAVSVVLASLVPVAIWPLRAFVVTGNPLWPASFGPLGNDESVRLGPSIVELTADRGREVLVLAALAALLLYLGLGPLIGLSIRPIWRWCRGQRLIRLGIVAPAVGFLAYLVTPMTGFWPGGTFVTQRYYAAVVAMLMLVFAAVRMHEDAPNARRWRIAVGCSIGLGVVSIAVAHSPALQAWPWWVWVAGFVIGGLATWQIVAGRLPVRVVRQVLALAAVTVLGLLSVVPAVHEAHWYPAAVFFWSPMRPALDWHRENQIRASNIAYSGVLPQPFYGPDLSNRVYYLTGDKPDSSYPIFVVKDDWEHALGSTCTDYIVVGNSPHGAVAAVWTWASESDALTLITGDDSVRVYAVNHQTREPRCTAGSSDTHAG